MTPRNSFRRTLSGHVVEWRDEPAQEPEYSMVYGMRGMIGQTRDREGHPPSMMVRCRECRHSWRESLSQEEWDRLQSWERDHLGHALTDQIVSRDRLTCEDRRNLALCAEVMRT